MDSIWIDAGVVAASLGLFFGAYGLARLMTRPARPRPVAASPELGAEPPAVVNLLTNRWRLNQDAAEATLLDLAARRLIELRQPGNDPYQTTIHLRDGTEGTDDTGHPLTPYERRALDRIRGLAIDGVVPVTALTFRDKHRARAWTRRLKHDVVRDARARGLSRRRFSAPVIAALLLVAVPSAVGFGFVSLRLTGSEGGLNLSGGFWGVLMSFLILAGVVFSMPSERDTPAGAAAAARWLGVRSWLRGHEEFADLPPAAVTVWDRYLPYGAALGVTHTASAVLDLGMGDRRRVWSSYGGRWRRVRVRYPKVWLRYGASAAALAFRAVLGLGLGTVLVLWHDLPAREVGALAQGADAADLIRGLEIASRLGFWLGIALLVLNGYMLVRALLDLATTRTITGEVLWIERWRSRSRGKNGPSVPWLDYLAVDDGGDQTTAWGLPRGKLPRVEARDVVTIRVRRWSRRVIDLTVLERARAVTDPPVEPFDPTPGSVLGAAFGGVLGSPGRAAAAGPPTGSPPPPGHADPDPLHGQRP